MVKILIDLLLIAFIVTFIIDISGFIDSIKYAIWKRFVKIGDYRNLQLKPFTCSLCMTFWCSFIYLIITGNFILPFIAFGVLLSMLSSNIGDFIQFIKDAFTSLINCLYKLIK